MNQARLSPEVREAQSYNLPDSPHEASLSSCHSGLKVLMNGPEGNDLYCTLTHVQVYGKSMHLSLKESFKFVNSKANSTQVTSQPTLTRVNTTQSDSCESKYPETFNEFIKQTNNQGKEYTDKDLNTHVIK